MRRSVELAFLPILSQQNRRVRKADTYGYCLYSLLPGSLLLCSFVQYPVADFNHNFWPRRGLGRKSFGCLGLGRGERFSRIGDNCQPSACFAFPELVEGNPINRTMHSEAVQTAGCLCESDRANSHGKR